MKLQEVLELVNEYSEKYRHPNLAKFEISGLYDLYPDLHTVQFCSSKWPDVWEHCGNCGVYFFTDDNLEVIYIGKASHFGYRFGSYFMYGENKKCQLKDSRISDPRFVITVAIPSETSFESPALEEFLIRTVQPHQNTIGK